MVGQKKAKLLRIFVSSTDKFEHKPLYEEIVYAAKKFDISGATVIKGIMGYGASSQIYSQKLWEVSEKIPVIIEIVDEEEKIGKFISVLLPFLDNSGKGCMVTMEDASIILAKKGKK
ncbi:MAG: hypothetical protein A2X18_14215 [Bacteroidetes bacterium GWF2_40_14]|nr:MAG: hypothetical protein A2X18_14215 [Bacteroidetes bacterium GWF2_40_14]